MRIFPIFGTLGALHKSQVMDWLIFKSSNHSPEWCNCCNRAKALTLTDQIIIGVRPLILSLPSGNHSCQVSQLPIFLRSKSVFLAVITHTLSLYKCAINLFEICFLPFFKFRVCCKGLSFYHKTVGQENPISRDELMAIYAPNFVPTKNIIRKTCPLELFSSSKLIGRLRNYITRRCIAPGNVTT